MPVRVRVLLALAVLKLGWLVSDSVRALALGTRINAERLAYDMGGVELGVAAVAIALAIALPGPVGVQLGLGRSRLRWFSWPVVVLGTLGLSIALGGVVEWTRADEGSVLGGIRQGMRSAGFDLGTFVISVLGSALAPGVCEEILCRGVVQRNLTRVAGPVLAIAASTLLFGALHGEWVQGGFASVIGLYLGLIAHWADSARPTIVAHVANNLLAILGASGLLLLQIPLPVSVPLGLALSAAGLWLAWRGRPHGEPK